MLHKIVGICNTQTTTLGKCPNPSCTGLGNRWLCVMKVWTSGIAAETPERPVVITGRAANKVMAG
jgi:hypothetical protein